MLNLIIINNNYFIFLTIVYDKETLDRISEIISVSSLLKIDEFKKSSRTNLMQRIKNRKRFNLSVSIAPSFILVPEAGSIKDANYILLISLGHFDISSKLSNKTEHRLDLADDEYLIDISKLQLTLSDKQNMDKDIEHVHNRKIDNQQSNEHHLICPITLSLILSPCIKMNGLDSPLIRLNIEIPKIESILEHTLILNVVKLILSIISINKLGTNKSKTVNNATIQVQFQIKVLEIELKNKNNTIVKSMSDLIAKFGIEGDKKIILNLDLNLKSTQFTCCMNHFHFLIEIKKQIKQLFKAKKPNVSNKQANCEHLLIYIFSRLSKKYDEIIFELDMARVDIIMLEDYELKNNGEVKFNTVFNLKIHNYEQKYLIGIENVAISPNMIRNLMKMLEPFYKLGNYKKINDAKKEKIVTANEFERIKEIDKSIWFIKLNENGSGKISQDSDIVLEAIKGQKFDSGSNLALQSDSKEEDKIFRQELIFEIKIIDFVIESGGVLSIPLIKFNSNLNAKFVNYQELHVKTQMFMEYFNNKNFNWEPIIDIIDNEKWNFDVKIKFSSPKEKVKKKTLISFESDKKLEITLSNISLNVFKSLISSFSNEFNETEVLFNKEQKLIIKNETEMILFLYIDMSKFKCQETSHNQKRIDSRFSLFTLSSFSLLTLLPLTKDAIDVNSTLNYSFIINGKEFNRSISLLSNDKSINLVYCNIYPDNNWKYVIDSSLRDIFTKYIIFHSNVIIQNHLKMPVSVYRNDEIQVDKTKRIGDIDSEDRLYLPFSLIYSHENQFVYIRPRDNYKDSRNDVLICNFNDQKLFKIIQCKPIDSEKNQTIYIRAVRHSKRIRIEDCDEKEVTSFDNLYYFELYPQFLIRNLLPIELTYRTYEGQEGKKLKSGEDNHIIDIKLTKNSEIRLDFLDYNNKAWFCLKSNFRWPEEDCTEIWEFLKTSTSETLLIAINFMNSDENGLRLLTVFAPYWMINNTDLSLKYSLGDDLNVRHEPNRSQVCLLSFKSTQLAEKKKIRLALDESKFSEQFSIDKIGNKDKIEIEMNDNSLCFFTIETCSSRFSLTKIIKISAFYKIVSKINFNIELSEDRDRWLKLNSKSSLPFFPKITNLNDQLYLYLRLPGEKEYSKAISLKCKASTLLKVNDAMICSNTEITSHTVIIEIKNYYSDCSPLLVVNCLEDLHLDYSQKYEEGQFSLPPLSMVHYNWQNPLGFCKLTCSTKKKITNDLNKDANAETLNNHIFKISFYYDNQKVFLVTKNKEAYVKLKKFSDRVMSSNASSDFELILNMNGIGVSIINSSILKELCYISITSNLIWKHKKNDQEEFKNFKENEIGLLEEAYKKFGRKFSSTAPNNLVFDFENMKVLRPFKAELKRTTDASGIYFNLSKSGKSINIELEINSIQIDNQLDVQEYLRILFPVSPSRPFIKLNTIIQLNNNRRCFKKITFSMQEFKVQIDKEFYDAFKSFLTYISSDVKTNANYEELVNESLKLSLKNKTDLISSRYFFDSIDISTITMHSNIWFLKDASFNKNSFKCQNKHFTYDEFLDELYQHYNPYRLSQFCSIAFGIDVFGIKITNNQIIKKTKH